MKLFIDTNIFIEYFECRLQFESVRKIFNALEDKTTDTSGTVWKVTLGTANKAKLSADELKIATDKGWSVE